MDLAGASGKATVPDGVAGDSFIANFRQVSLEGTKARGRYIATRQQLEKVKQAPSNDGRFALEIEDTKLEVSALMANLAVELQAMKEVDSDFQDIAQEIDDLVDDDAKMSDLLTKMNRKLDVFESALGNF